MVLAEELRTAREEYEDLGFDTLPLKPGSKDPVSRAWQRQEPSQMWRHAPDNANIGIRGGGDAHFAVLDFDEKKQRGSVQSGINWLAGLGYLPGDYPFVKTASRIGRQVYATFSGGLPGDFRNFSTSFAAGEFRYGPGSYVAVPPSTIMGGATYALIDGDLRQLPRLTLTNILPILSNQDTAPEPKAPSIPRGAFALLKGKGVEKFPSRSEAEQSIIVSLVNAGHSFESVLDLFLRYSGPGKFAELHSKSETNAIRWLRHSYDKARLWAETHETKGRQQAKAALTWAQSIPWAGRTGAVDRAVFLAHATIAYKAGRLVYAASARDLAELAGVSHMTATRATFRLSQSNLLILDRPGVADYANIYHLIPLGQTVTLPHKGLLRECNSLSNHDVFRARGLGKSAFEVWSTLGDDALTVEEIAERTGRCVKTVKRALERMAGIMDTVTGELLPMVETRGERWAVLEIDLGQIAQVVGTAGTGERQKRRHREDRRAHAHSLKSIRKEIKSSDSHRIT